MSFLESSTLLHANNLFREEKYFAAIEQYKSLAAKNYYSDICNVNLILSYLKVGMTNEASKTAYEFAVHHSGSGFSSEINRYLNKTVVVTNKGPKLSIIVPVYNSGQYLEKCLGSIVNQDFRDFEIIIVNDGSTDNSAEIIARYSQQDDRVVVIENSRASGNPGTPRNQALDVCKGAYIGFVDSDDWLDQNFYSSLMEKAFNDFPDIVFSNGFKNCLNTGEVTTRKYNNVGFDDPQSQRYKFHDSFMIWDKVFHRRLITTYDIRLGETPAAVDVPFIFKAYYYCSSVQYVDDLYGYNYRRESESSVTVAHRKNSNCDFEFESYRNVLEWAATTNINSYYKQLIDIKLVNSLLYTLGLVNQEHFSGFLGKVKQAFASVNRAEFKDFCINNKKWWLYKEFLTVCEGSEGEVQIFLEKKKHDVAEKNYKKTVESKFALKGGKKGILFFPAWVGNNPYQKMLYEAVNKEFDVSVSGHTKEALCERFLKDKRDNFDYIHLHWLQAFINFSDDNGADYLLKILSYAKSLGYKIIYTAHNIISHDTEFAEREVLLRKKVAKHFDFALVHGDKAEEILIEKMGIDRQKICKVPHGSYGNYYGELIDKRIARSDFGLSDDAVVFLFFGNIKGYKGLGNLLQSFDRVYSRNDNAALIVAGNLVDEDSKKMVNDYLTHPAIKFRTGFIEDSLVKNLFSAADYTVLPFKKILTSGSAVLSLTFSRPVIAPNDGILPEFVTKDLGFLFNTYNEMEEIMSRISAGKDRIYNSKELIDFNDKYSWQRCVRNMASIFLR